jgi:hypothetical protein
VANLDHAVADGGMMPVLILIFGDREDRHTRRPPGQSVTAQVRPR